MEQEVVLEFLQKSEKAALFTIHFKNDGTEESKANDTYNENAELSGYVLTLQKFDEILRMELKKGTITIEQMEIAGYEDKIYKL